MKPSLKHADALKRSLLDFVLDSEGELAIALESYSADELARLGNSQQRGQDFVMDGFLYEGRVADASPIEWFLREQPDLKPELTEGDRQLLHSWHQSFVGLFVVTEVLPEGFQVMNWLTAKHYEVDADLSQPQVARLGPGEIFLTRLAPLAPPSWMFFSPLTLLGKLGKPKLAVAIGNFKQHHKKSMYGDAPELMAEAWRSVERQYQEFVDFFGSTEVTMSGYELSKKMTEFQSALTERRLAAAGIDGSQSLEALAQEAGISEAEMAELKQAQAEALQNEPNQAVPNQAASNQSIQKMMTPRIQLPDPLRKAEEVTVLTHPVWGQIFLPHYRRFKQLLGVDLGQDSPQKSGADSALKDAIKIARQYWNDPTIPSPIWQQLAAEFPVGLVAVLRAVSGKPAFEISDLDELLKSTGKPLEVELPEIASVPLHLHELFQEAIAEVSKNKETKAKPAAKKGFQSR